MAAKQAQQGEPAKAVACIELDDDLVLENASRSKHEYLDGVIDAVHGEVVRGLAGGQAHSLLTRNVVIALHARLRGSRCEVLATEMRLRIGAASALFHRDVLVHCGDATDPVNTFEPTAAKLVAEVLSPGTERFDRGDKFAAYRALAGLQHILLLSSTEPAAWSCQRVPADAAWTELAPWPAGTALALPGLGVEIGSDEGYGGAGLG